MDGALELPFSALQGMLHLSCGHQPHDDFCPVSEVREAGPCCWHVCVEPFRHLAPPRHLDNRVTTLARMGAWLQCKEPFLRGRVGGQKRVATHGYTDC